MSELLLDREGDLFEQLERESPFTGADYGMAVLAHEVDFGGDDEDKPNKEDSGDGGEKLPILEPIPPKREGADDFLGARFGITMSNSGGQPRPGEGGPIPPPQKRTPKKPEEPPRPHP